ncbi:ATP synthase subunit a [Bremerella volcania]|uniref:ATP synthase subunit a n=1 Tax=Bremerella volcania TaxID=2527984 RepID=A0A518C5P8_9BACT|nr:F0F1 ATP synthase subunit A [Bremerella volcania]QDU74532.1 ATP synthase subunit a [Bremerella volcania]
MAADEILLHIKDSYYFEVPKWLWKHDHESHSDFPDVWVKLDPGFQTWQAHEVYHRLEADGAKGLPSEDAFILEYEHWLHEPGNHGKPIKRFLNSKAEESLTEGGDVLEWAIMGEEVADEYTVAEYKKLPADHEHVNWAPSKIDGYNHALSGKILIPQPLGGELRNLYQKEAGFAISKFMVIEFFVAVIISVVFIAYARRVSQGQLPKGWFWNLIDVFITFLRKDVAKANIHHGADKFVPILWTLFFFILGCNLFGLIPWMGSPTGSISVTVTLALAVLFIGMGAGAKEFGALGVWLNLVPGMELPTVIAIIIKPMMFVIELLGLLIKHAVLGIRLLANMVAGHVVLLAIMGLAVQIQTAVGVPSAVAWPVVLVILVGSVLLSCLELFVAFLQAYVFALLTALFINSETHSH